MPAIARVATTMTLALGIIATGAPAAADSGAAARDAYLREHPGGTPLGPNEIGYQNGAFIITLTRPATTRAAADCPTGWYCFYDGPNYTYPRGRLSSCGFQNLGTYGWRDRTESVHYNVSTGSVTFINETGSTDTNLFTASTTNRRLPTVTPHGNRADYTFRSC